MENKTYIFIGAGSTISLEMMRTLENSNIQIMAFSRQPNPFPGLSNLRWFQGDFVSQGIPSDLIPEKADGFVYFPGTINLRPFTSLSMEEFSKDMEINFFGMVRTLKPFIPALKKSGKASVVLFSTVAVERGMAYHSSIAASKAAVEGFARSLAAEYAPIIRVNCVAPSLTATALAEKLVSNEERKTALAQKHPLKRIGEPADIASSVQFLLSENSLWITGQVIAVDGGMSTLSIN
jgi:3-oxoacyl-[acyl-carrier protein] reductase